MGYIKFLKENEQTQKSNYLTGHKKLNRHRKIWKIFFILSMILNIYLINEHCHIYKIDYLTTNISGYILKLLYQI